jgi:hypothetical protein
MRLETPAECRRMYPEAALYDTLRRAIGVTLRELTEKHGPPHCIPEGVALRAISKVCMLHYQRVVDESGRRLWPWHLDCMVDHMAQARDKGARLTINVPPRWRG